jgi:hypothetical protein
MHGKQRTKLRWEGIAYKINKEQNYVGCKHSSRHINEKKHAR